MGSICPHPPREERLSLSPHTELVSPGRWRIFLCITCLIPRGERCRHLLFFFVWLGLVFCVELMWVKNTQSEMCCFCSVTLLELQPRFKKSSFHTQTWYSRLFTCGIFQTGVFWALCNFPSLSLPLSQHVKMCCWHQIQRKYTYLQRKWS